ncbi:MAG TPA: type II toxin-antitoxin system death-on-curing family toxin [Candidatus Saccharibacteria bacterium]|nr:type II toxin-antitoxin system death-on-curing family toxin [Candidatus Saccharibacteria bacterium]HRQ07102.1 type II toxin-antitoxin system death-on-curing family toxin [Candidatus Saccharibacteria bacterium]
MKKVTIQDAEYVAYKSATALMDYGEPMPDFETRYPGKLEASLEASFTYISGKYVYWTLPHRAAVYFYSIIKNHPFENGNKRMAVMILLVFLFVNKKWITISADDLYVLAKDVAKSSAQDRETVILSLKKEIKSHLIKIK